MSLSPQAIAERGEKIYKNKFKESFEKTAANKYVAVELESEQAFVGETAEEAIEKAQAAKDGGLFHLIKVGSPGVFRVGYYADWHGEA